MNPLLGDQTPLLDPEAPPLPHVDPTEHHGWERRKGCDGCFPYNLLCLSLVVIALPSFLIISLCYDTDQTTVFVWWIDSIGVLLAVLITIPIFILMFWYWRRVYVTHAIHPSFCFCSTYEYLVNPKRCGGLPKWCTERCGCATFYAQPRYAVREERVRDQNGNVRSVPVFYRLCACPMYTFWTVVLVVIFIFGTFSWLWLGDAALANAECTNNPNTTLFNCTGVTAPWPFN